MNNFVLTIWLKEWGKHFETLGYTNCLWVDIWTSGVPNTTHFRATFCGMIPIPGRMTSPNGDNCRSRVHEYSRPKGSISDEWRWTVLEIMCWVFVSGILFQAQIRITSYSFVPSSMQNYIWVEIHSLVCIRYTKGPYTLLVLVRQKLTAAGADICFEEMRRLCMQTSLGVHFVSSRSWFSGSSKLLSHE
jgi:hypothetical protein